jgi:beta-glucosidase
VTAAREEFLRLNAWRHGPLYRGGYPEDEWQRAGRDVPELADGDIEIIAEPQDFLGLNVYSSWTVAQAGRQLAEPESHFPRTQMGWPIMPDCLRWAARFAHETCNPAAILITECGCAWDDQVDDRGEVDDFARIEFMRSHLRGVEQALEEGIPIRGFFLWSLLDNFEWAHGFSRRFGIVHVNFETLKRTPKASARWYARHIAANTTARPEMALANQ